MKKPWTVRFPFQPKDSDCEYAGAFSVLGIEFSDNLPSWLNNFLWKVRDLPVIDTLSTFFARGGISRCFSCNHFMYPWQTLISHGNVYEEIFPTMDTHQWCYNKPPKKGSNMWRVQFIEDHSFQTFYRPDYFVQEALSRPWKEITDRVNGPMQERLKERMEKFPIHELVKKAIQ